MAIFYFFLYFGILFNMAIVSPFFSYSTNPVEIQKSKRKLRGQRSACCIVPNKVHFFVFDF